MVAWPEGSVDAARAAAACSSAAARRLRMHKHERPCAAPSRWAAVHGAAAAACMAWKVPGPRAAREARGVAAQQQHADAGATAAVSMEAPTRTDRASCSGAGSAAIARAHLAAAALPTPAHALCPCSSLPSAPASGCSLHHASQQRAAGGPTLRASRPAPVSHGAASGQRRRIKGRRQGAAHQAGGGRRYGVAPACALHHACEGGEGEDERAAQVSR
jgi:hypothetical protein